MGSRLNIIWFQKEESMETVPKKKIVLIVEDDSDINAMLCLLFRQEGYDVISAANGKEALELLKSHQKPALILLDLWMPVLDAAGFRAIQEMDPSISDIPVIVMSADHALDIKGLKLGLNHRVKKPIEIQELMESVEQALRKAT